MKPMKQSDLCSVVGNAVRVNIICCLGSSEKTVTQLIDRCRLSQSAVSQHLRKLRESGCVSVRTVGKTRVYKTTNSTVLEMCRRIAACSCP